MLSPIFIVAFTGNRPSDAAGRSPEELEAMRDLLGQTLQAFADKAGKVGGKIHLLSGAATGADTIACEVAQGMGIPVHLVLPMAEERFRDDFEGDPEGWARSEALIRRAREGADGGTLRVSRIGGARPDCYANTNHEMLDAADGLIAMSNGDDTGKTGGTGETMAAAGLRGIPAIHLNTVTRASDAEGREEEALTGFAPGDPARDGGALIRKLEESVESSGVEVDASSTRALHETLDRAAGKLKKRLSAGVKAGMWLHGTASLLGAFGVSYALSGGAGKQWVLLAVGVIELVLIFRAERIHARQHKDRALEAFLGCRFAAELLRPADVIYPYLDVLRPLIGQRERRWRRFTLSALLLTRRKPIEESDLESLKERYLTDRLEDQIAYFQREKSTSEPADHRYYNLVRILSLAAVAAVAIAAAFKVSHVLPEGFFQFLQGDGTGVAAAVEGTPDIPSFFLNFFLNFLPISLPLLAGIYAVLRVALDHARRTLRYDYMIELLQNARGRVLSAPTTASLLSAVLEIEDGLLQEVSEFYLAQETGLKR